MGFRKVNGSEYTENGWRCCNRDEADLVRFSAIPDKWTRTAPIRKGSPLINLGAWLWWYHHNVEPITSEIWAWSLNNDVLGRYGMNEGSNHLSATAVDVNAPKYPWGLLRMPADKVAKVEQGLRLFSPTGRIEDSVIFWGRVWRKPDEMHFQLRFREGDKRNDEFAAKLLSGYLGIYKADPGTKPVPATPRKPVVPGDGGTLWSDVSQYQVVPVDDSYPDRVFSFRTNSGDKQDVLARENARSAKDLLDAGKLDIVIPYYFFRPGQANCDLHRKMLEDSGLWNHPRTVTMVDVEGDNGSVKGDNSWEINDEITRLQGWYQNPARVIGYLNSNADPGLWRSRNGVNLVVPQYGRTPGDISSIQDPSVRSDAIAHQFTDRATGIAPWADKGIDRNWSPYSVEELLLLFGMKKGSTIVAGLEEAILNIERLVTEIHDRLIRVPWHGGKWPSRAIFRDSDDGVDDTVGMLLNGDGNGWDAKVVIEALAGVPKQIARVERLARGEGPEGDNPDSVAAAQAILKTIKGDQS